MTVVETPRITRLHYSLYPQDCITSITVEFMRSIVTRTGLAALAIELGETLSTLGIERRYSRPTMLEDLRRRKTGLLHSSSFEANWHGL